MSDEGNVNVKETDEIVYGFVEMSIGSGISKIT